MVSRVSELLLLEWNEINEMMMIQVWENLHFGMNYSLNLYIILKKWLNRITVYFLCRLWTVQTNRLCTQFRTHVCQRPPEQFCGAVRPESWNLDCDYRGRGYSAGKTLSLYNVKCMDSVHYCFEKQIFLIFLQLRTIWCSCPARITRLPSCNWKWLNLVHTATHRMPIRSQYCFLLCTYVYNILYLLQTISVL